MVVTPFNVCVPDSELVYLKNRLDQTRWPDQFEESTWRYGTDLTHLQSICDYWATKYDWRTTEATINSYPNFIAQAQDQQIHFVHVKGRSKQAVPLLLTHGWPGSFLELLPLVPFLTSDSDFSFDVVIPSIPGFGFSSRPTRPGANSAWVASLWHQLMVGLGYPHYGAQGGDIGAGISSWLALQQPQALMGLHLNYIPGSFKPYLGVDEKYTPEIVAYQQEAQQWAQLEGAYANLQSTKPQTLAYALNDSPVGLCGWMLEKFYHWTDPPGALSQQVSYDVLLGNVSLYWLTQTISSSMRIYAENRLHPLIFGPHDFINTPVAFAQFPGELPTPPRSYVEKGYAIQRWTIMPKGGHFAALEQSALLSADIKQFFERLPA